jgi:hypothetical protein
MERVSLPRDSADCAGPLQLLPSRATRSVVLAELRGMCGCEIEALDVALLPDSTEEGEAAAVVAAVDGHGDGFVALCFSERAGGEWRVLGVERFARVPSAWGRGECGQGSVRIRRETLPSASDRVSRAALSAVETASVGGLFGPAVLRRGGALWAYVPAKRVIDGVAWVSDGGRPDPAVLVCDSGRIGVYRLARWSGGAAEGAAADALAPAAPEGEDVTYVDPGLDPLGSSSGTIHLGESTMGDERMRATMLVLCGRGALSRCVFCSERKGRVKVEVRRSVATSAKFDVVGCSLHAMGSGVLGFFAGSGTEVVVGAVGQLGGVGHKQAADKFRRDVAANAASAAAAAPRDDGEGVEEPAEPRGKRARTDAPPEDGAAEGGAAAAAIGNTPGGILGRLTQKRALGFSAGARIVGFDTVTMPDDGPHAAEIVGLVLRDDGRILVATPMQGMAPPWLLHAIDAYTGPSADRVAGVVVESGDALEAGLRLDRPC